MRSWLVLAILIAITSARPPGSAAASTDTTATIEALLHSARMDLGRSAIEAHQRAVKALDQALQLAPRNPELWIERGRAHEIAGEDQASCACFEEAVRLTPGNPDAWSRLGTARKRQWLRSVDSTAFDLAFESFAEVTELRPDDCDGWLQLVPLLFEDRRLTAAWAAAERAQDLCPRSGEAWLAIAYLAYRQGEIELADSAFAIAIALLPPALRARFDDVSVIAPDEDPPREWSAGGASTREFWRPLDPDPTTPQNEAQLEYWSRVAHVHFLFDDPVRSGLDARAEMYLRYGPPRRVDARPAGVARYFVCNPANPTAPPMYRPLIPQVWDYPELGMRVLLQDRRLTGRYDTPIELVPSAYNHPSPEVLARRGDLLALQNGFAVFPTLPPPAQRIEVRGTAERFEGEQGPRLVTQFAAPAEPGDTLSARCTVLDAKGREVWRGAQRLVTSACDPTALQVGTFSTDLPAGDYRVTVSVRDTHRRRGLYKTPVGLAAVPAALALSDVVLVCGSPALFVQESSVRIEPDLDARLSGRTPLVVYFEIYRLTPAPNGIARFEYEYSVRPLGESERRSHRRSSRPAALVSSSATRVETQAGTMRRQFVTVPIQSLPAGRYRLEVRVRDLEAGSEVSGAVEFEKK